MKLKERDELLGRLDERTANIWRATEQQEKHLSKINDSLMKHAVQISSNRTSIKWIVRILIASGIIGGTTTGLINWLG